VAKENRYDQDMKRTVKGRTDKHETFGKLAKKMKVDLKHLVKAESAQFYPYTKDDQKRLAVTFFIPSGEDFPRYEELCVDEPLSWFISEIWKPQIKKRIAALPRQRSQQVQLAFYEKLGENLGIDIEELWNKQIEKAFLKELKKREERGSEAAPIFSEESFYAAAGFVFPDEVGSFLQGAIDRIAKTTIDLLAKRLEEKEGAARKGK
jgi:hypothetical protein